MMRLEPISKPSTLLFLLFIIISFNVKSQCTPPSLIISDQSICTPDSVDLNDAVGPGSDPANLSFYNSQADANAVANPISSYVLFSGSFWIRAEDLNDPNCFEVYEVVVTVLQTAVGIDTNVVCSPFTWPNDGRTYPFSNHIITDTLFGAAANGCDSIVQLDLTVSEDVQTTDIIYSCDPYTWIDGNTYTTSNTTASVMLTNSAGCDSLVTLDLTIKQVDTLRIDTTICPNETFTYNGKTYSSSGLYYDTLNSNNYTTQKNINYGTSQPVSPSINNNYGWGKPTLYYDYTNDGASVNYGGGDFSFVK